MGRARGAAAFCLLALAAAGRHEGGALDDSAMMQHRPPRMDAVVAEQQRMELAAELAADPNTPEPIPHGDDTTAEPLANFRLLASIKSYPDFHLPNDTTATGHVRSVVPVFPPNGDEPYIAFMVDYSHPVYYGLRDSKLMSCRSGDHMSPIQSYGGEYHDGGRWSFVLKCAWPREWQSQECHNVTLVDTKSGRAMQQYQTCHDPALAAEGGYELAACVEPMREYPDRLGASGIMMLPQWLEYSVSKGVQHFLVYTTKHTDLRQYAAMKPYLEAKMITQVRVEPGISMIRGGGKTQLIVINDCLHRMRGKTKWLMPSIDTDEYSVFNSSESVRSMRYQDAIHELISRTLPVNESKPVDDSEVHAITFPRINVLHPERPYENLQIESAIREPHQACMSYKYFLQANLVDNLFVHWPMSWRNGTRLLGSPLKDLVAYHYRLFEANKTVADTTLSNEADALSRALNRRYGEPWSVFAQRLLPPAAPAAAGLIATREMRADHAGADAGADGLAFDDAAEAGLASEADLAAEAALLAAMAKPLADFLATLTEPRFIEDIIVDLVG